jgi:hypothetical protein
MFMIPVRQMCKKTSIKCKPIISDAFRAKSILQLFFGKKKQPVALTVIKQKNKKHLPIRYFNIT